MKKTFLLILLFCFSKSMNAQVGIATANPQAALDITSSTNGFLIPRVALTSRNVAAPVVNPQGGAIANSTLVYNTATAGISPNNVTPGFYYWETATLSWKSFLATPTNDWALTGNTGTNPSTNFIGTLDDRDLVFRRFNVRAGLINITNTSYGLNSLNPLNTGTYNTVFGIDALKNNTTGTGNIAFGWRVLELNPTGSFNTVVGNASMMNNIDGFQNAAFGDLVLRDNSNGIQNAGFGTNALIANISGSQNAAFGVGSLNFSMGSYNTGLGYFALGNLLTGDNNIGIGNQAEVPNINGSNQLSIGNQIYGTAINDILLGKIGIGEPNPTEKLDVFGNLKLSGAFMPNNNSGNSGELLFSNGPGVAPSWANPTVKSYITTGSATGIYNVALTEYTVRIFNGVSEVRLPNATTNTGKIYIIIGSNGIGSKTFSTAGGVIYDDVTNANITSITANQRYMIQSDGTDWIVIGR